MCSCTWFRPNLLLHIALCEMHFRLFLLLIYTEILCTQLPQCLIECYGFSFLENNVFPNTALGHLVVFFNLSKQLKCLQIKYILDTEWPPLMFALEGHDLSVPLLTLFFLTQVAPKTGWENFLPDVDIKVRYCSTDAAWQSCSTSHILR